MTSQSNRPPGHPAFDPIALAKLRSLDPGGRTGLVKRILSVYETTLPKNQAAAQTALLAEDWPALKFAAHSLKGSSGSVGAMRLLHASSELEQAAIRQDAEGAPELLRLWIAEIDAVRVELAPLLAA